MERHSPKRPEKMQLNLIVILLICQHGNSATAPKYELNCLSDYLFTIECSLVIAQPQSRNTSSWLTFTKRTQRFQCWLKGVNGRYHCSLTTCPENDPDECDNFLDVNVFQISLCHDGVESCEMLDDKYMPLTHIKPNPPCCLAVSHNSSQHHFTWRSTYEYFSDISGLVKNLDYELHYYEKHDGDNGRSGFINTNSLNYSMDDKAFSPDKDYAARVRSTPSGGHYKGQWSEWSPEVHWRTEPAVSDPRVDTLISVLVQVVLVFSFVTLPFILFLCYAPVKKWWQSTFIPTPEPYFQSLYTGCQGDFKSWADTQEKTDTLKAEETSPIDSLTKCVVVQEDDYPQVCCQPQQGSTYRNISDSGCEASLLGMPYAVSTMAPPSTTEESFKPGSPGGEDSGCWLSSDMSLERYPPWYCNEYCTLNALQQPCS